MSIIKTKLAMLAVCLTTLLSAGCYDIEKHRLEEAKLACADNGGIDRLETIVWLSVYCEDGTYIQEIAQ